MPVFLSFIALSLVIAAVATAVNMTPKARARRAAARRHRHEMAALRSRVGASARATYRRQFPNSHGHTGSAAHDVGPLYGAVASDGGSNCDTGGSDGGGGDAGC